MSKIEAVGPDSLKAGTPTFQTAGFEFLVWVSTQ